MKPLNPTPEYVMLAVGAVVIILSLVYLVHNVGAKTDYTKAWEWKCGHFESNSDIPRWSNCSPTSTIQSVAKSTHSEITMYAVKEVLEEQILTAYSPYETCEKGLSENCIDASGSRPVSGVTVTCPRKYPLGTRAYIKNVGRRTCSDRTSERYDSRWDLFVEDYQAAKAFGKRKLTVFILE